MKSFLSMVMFNIVVTGVTYWGYMLGNHSASTVATILLWSTSVIGLFSISMIGKAVYEPGYEIKSWIHRVIASAFDVANALIAIQDNKPILAAIILISASLMSVYIREKSKAQKLGRLA